MDDSQEQDQDFICCHDKYDQESAAPDVAETETVSSVQVQERCQQRDVDWCCVDTQRVDAWALSTVWSSVTLRWSPDVHYHHSR